MFAKLVAGLRSNAVAFLALFLALGGTAWAAAKIGSDDIKRNAIESRHIAGKEVRASDLKPRYGGPRQIAGGAVGPDQLGAVPRAELATNAAQSFTNAMETVEFDSAAITDGMSTATNGDIVFVDRPGVYDVSGEVHWEADPSGDRILELRLDPGVGDARVVATDIRPAAEATNSISSVATTVELRASDGLSLQAAQQSGGALELSNFNDFSARLAIQYLGPPPRFDAGG